MSFSRALYNRVFPPVANGDDQAKLLTYVHGAGTPAETNAKPDFVGQEYLDTDAQHFWKATGLEVGEWKRITTDNP